MCARVMLGKGRCPIEKPEIIENTEFQAQHAELLAGKKHLEELPEVLKQFEECFKCLHFDIKTPSIPAASP